MLLCYFLPNNNSILLAKYSPSSKAHADFMGIGVSADANIDIHDVQIYMDATATLTSEGLPEGGLQLTNFYVSRVSYPP